MFGNVRSLDWIGTAASPQRVASKKVLLAVLKRLGAQQAIFVKSDRSGDRCFVQLESRMWVKMRLSSSGLTVLAVLSSAGSTEEVIGDSCELH